MGTENSTGLSEVLRKELSVIVDAYRQIREGMSDVESVGGFATEMIKPPRGEGVEFVIGEADGFRAVYRHTDGAEYRMLVQVSKEE